MTFLHISKHITFCDKTICCFVFIISQHIFIIHSYFGYVNSYVVENDIKSKLRAVFDNFS